MKTYAISYTLENWYRVEIEASSEEEALEKFHEGDFDVESRILTNEGYLQEDPDVTEVTA